MEEDRCPNNNTGDVLLRAACWFINKCCNGVGHKTQEQPVNLQTRQKMVIVIGANL